VFFLNFCFAMSLLLSSLGVFFNLHRLSVFLGMCFVSYSRCGGQTRGKARRNVQFAKKKSKNKKKLCSLCARCVWERVSCVRFS